MANNPLVNIFRIKDLRDRILFTIGLLVISRFGTFIPIPGIDRNAVFAYFNSASSSSMGGIVDFLDFFVGGALKNVSIFMLGIMPYITTSIIMQLLTIIFPTLKKIQEEEGGRKKIQRITRFATIPVCLIQSLSIRAFLADAPYILTVSQTQFTIMAMITVTAGTCFLMWMGEQITQRGVGNGISLLIFANIVARFPSSIVRIVQAVKGEGLNPVFLILVFIMFLGVIALVIYEQQGQRKIPVYYAKRVVGRKVYGAQNTYLPFKINPSGVIPVIFASALLTFPIQIAQSFGGQIKWISDVANFLAWNKLPYNVLYALMIILFGYFYTQVTLNPAEISKNIRENGGSIPGIRSEKMEEYLTRILTRIILPGSLFLAFIAIIPTFITITFNFPRDVAMLMGGTSLIIMVGVDLDLMSQIEGHLRMHHHDGLMKKGRIKGRNL